MRTLLFLSLLLISCEEEKPFTLQKIFVHEDTTDIPRLIADSFDSPVGNPPGNGYYDAQPFRKNNHLGEDWNGLGGGNSDLGDPVYAIANGKVIYASHNGAGWGNVITMRHFLPGGTAVESLYAHCDSMFVKQGDWIEKGVLIGTIGTADGYYPAHLHFEIRDKIGMPIGGGYSTNTEGFVDPSEFIRNH